MGESKARGGMGFRDFVCFNKALLAKQCWRLWQVSGSLVLNIIKAKYYPNGTLLDASLGNTPSFAWRSIWGARDLLERGLFSRIGNGQQTRIWGHKWVPIPTTYSIQSYPRILDPDAKVSDLIDVDTKRWNTRLIEEVFLPNEVKAILSIPLSVTGQEDRIIWRGTAKGIFTVRSAYYMAMEDKTQKQAESSGRGDFSELWKLLWKLQVPNGEIFFFMESLP